MAPISASADGQLAPSEDGESEGLSWTLRSIYSMESEIETEPPVTIYQPRGSLIPERRADSATPLTRRSAVIKPRGLHKGGIAGITVGCFIIACIALFCLWPFIIRRIKARKRQSSAATPDDDLEGTTISCPPGTWEKPEATADHGPSSTRPCSGEFQHGSTSSAPAGRSSPSTKETAVDSAQTTHAAVQSSVAKEATAADSAPQRNDSAASRRLSGASGGHAPKWNTEGPPPLTPGGIELVTTRADGLEYSEAMAGHSASYYYSPPEAFGITTPPMTGGDQEHEQAAAQRSSSRASSLKYNLMSFVRRMSSKDTAQAPSPTTAEGSAAAPSPAPASRSLGSPAFAQHATFGGQITESPVMQTGPSFQDFRFPAGHAPRLASPVPFPLPMSPASTAGAASDADAAYSTGPGVLEKPGESSPHVLPPSSPPPGTVNPMDVMAPSNPSEQVWRTDHELYYLAHSEASPPSPVSPTQPRTHDLTPPSNPVDVRQHVNPPPNNPLDAPQYVNPPPPIPEEEISVPVVVKQEPVSRDPVLQEPMSQEPVSQGPAPVATFPTYPTYHTMVQPSANHASSQLTPSTHGRVPSSDEHWTAVADHSTPMPSQGSMLSAHATPNTQLSETSPAASWEPHYPDIRNSTSPFNSSNGSPGRYICDHCGRTFDQVHKLNHHRRYHERPHKCTHQGCDKQFGTKTHLERHVNDKHNKLRKFHCLEPSCPYSKVGGKAFPRKDNWRRHMINKHGMSPSADPEPDLADEAMSGMT